MIRVHCSWVEGKLSHDRYYSTLGDFELAYCVGALACGRIASESIAVEEDREDHTTEDSLRTLFWIMFWVRTFGLRLCRWW